MKNLVYFAEQISSGKDLSVNLQKYSTGMLTMYSSLAYMKMSMNYYTLIDMLNDGTIKDEIFYKHFEDVTTLVDKIAINGELEEGITQADNIRNEIIHIMEIITNYVDKFRVFEHVLNRVEYRFKDTSPDMDYYNTYLTNDLMHYILSDRDNVAINGKISEIVGQLPVRMSKGSFYEHIKDAFTLYHGAQKGSIDDFYYNLSTCAMLSDTSDGKNYFAECDEAFNKLKNTDFAELSKDAYEILRSLLDDSIATLTEAADNYVLLCQVVNDIYTVSLSLNGSLQKISEIETARDIMKESIQAYKSCGNLDSIAYRFTEFEGKQEKILAEVSQSDFAVDFAVKNYETTLDELSLKDAYTSLVKVVKLQSGSDFVSLKEDKLFEEIPDDSYADNTALKLISQLDKAFEEQPVLVRRAVMAGVLSNLPVFFNNTNEIQDYINRSLIACSDTAEQSAVIEVMKMIISQ
ncbi:MAG: hypothetical protein ACI4E1_13050 [Lachnospira sp.]